MIRKLPRSTLVADNLPLDGEIDNLPLDIRCCYFIQPWNTSFSPTSIKEWAETLGWVIFLKIDTENMLKPLLREKATEKAVSEAYRLKDFITREFLLIAENLGRHGDKKM